VRLEGLDQLKNPVTSSGIEPTMAISVSLSAAVLLDKLIAILLINEFLALRNANNVFIATFTTAHRSV
jgi:hypothetical protein